MSLFLNYARSTPLYRALCALSVTEDGNLLERTHESTAEAQTEFLKWAVGLANPGIVVETGTNKGMFSYLLSLIATGVTVHTFDCEPKAAQAVELINQQQSNVNVVFHVGDTRGTLQKFHEPAEFAWIDGGHETDIALNDLLQCYRLRVPLIAVDDGAYPSVRNAVDYLLQHAPYVSITNPFGAQDRRGAMLLRLRPVECKARASACRTGSNRV